MALQQGILCTGNVTNLVHAIHLQVMKSLLRRAAQSVVIALVMDHTQNEKGVTALSGGEV